MQLVPTSREAGIDLDDFVAALSALAESGVARAYTPLTSTAQELGRLAASALASIEQSPSPDIEWNVAQVLGDDLATLVGTSVSSMHRYRSGERRTPDDTAARLHVIAGIVADLSGSYNEYGIRRWFSRPRSALAGSSPKQLLRGNWDPATAEVEAVRRLAYELTA